jgi:hypothetical protein
LDEEQVSQILIQADNRVYDNGYRITTGFVDKKVVVPESAESSNNQGESEETVSDNLQFSNVIHYYLFGYDCSNCRADFEVGGEATEDSLEATSRPKSADDSNVNEEFESYFLKALQRHGRLCRD